jgi:hypothetical protein
VEGCEKVGPLRDRCNAEIRDTRIDDGTISKGRA